MSAVAGHIVLAADGVPMRSLFEILRRRSQLIRRMLLGGAIATAVVMLLMPTRYTAKAQVVVEQSRTPHADERSSSAASSSQAGPDQATIQTEVAALSSQDLLANVLERLGEDPAFRSLRHAGSASATLAPAERARALERLGRQLHVFQEAGSHVISIAYTAGDPAEAALVANKITAYYLQTGEDKSRLATSQAASVLASKLITLRRDSEARESAVAAYQAAHDMNDGRRSNIIDQMLADLNHELSLAQSELAARRARYKELAALRAREGDWSQLLDGLDEAALLNLHNQLMATLTDRQTGVVVVPRTTRTSLDGQVAPASVREKVRSELNEALLKLRNDERVATAQVTSIAERLGRVQEASEDVQLHHLLESAESARRRYERLVHRRDELLEQADDVTAPARLLSWAGIPSRPSSLSPALLAMPALFALLLVSVVTALLQEQMDQRIYDASDVTACGARCAGLVPGLPPRGRAAAASTAQSTIAATTEALRRVWVSLQLTAMQGRRPQVVLVTSCRPEEGADGLTEGLAACAAYSGATTLLLKPWGRCGGAGIPELTGIEEVSQLLQNPPSGRDYIFIEGAAIAAQPEVRLLAPFADQIVLAARWRKSRREDLRRALELLGDCTVTERKGRAGICIVITRPERTRRWLLSQLG